ncbi:uncharacterized protein LOC122851982 [Aphidius gifuensis]|uniref:uncharacterized protein LOC122851982 n=1 Tax=Aphidius gifuensis TaxID=684658 RepID=UPI001CDB8CA8|nr:uncharacterized protein LOC122851982 [Aphidius gifuensis]XP_044007459.1 uncharacterized protein LOC122851982 [Aphidius gifuensis]XP_044007460.1 uncharacterized protein LOC122851982 [Aphidius gifuensis]XP_044007461.1 uncharacterized protein LOC122851982 [Aphidius gifuensis]XP_044007462.1 uncharacterized protein LOC122851982 [Aphidius gifuensis]
MNIMREIKIPRFHSQDGSLSIKDIPMQRNFWDCGVHICMYALYVCKNYTYNFTDKNMPAIRARIKSEILENKIQLPTPVKNTIILKTAHKNVLLYESAKRSQASVKFPEDRRNAECTTIATYVIAALSIYDHSAITQLSHIMNSIIIKGDEYYVNCRKHFPNSHRYLASDELLTQIIIDHKFIDVDINRLPMECTFNKTCGSELFLTLKNCINIYKSDVKKWGFLFMDHWKTVAFTVKSLSSGFLKKPCFFLFNSHRVDRDNLSTKISNLKAGSSRLFLCRTIDSLDKLLLLNHNMDNSIWQVYPIKVDKK